MKASVYKLIITHEELLNSYDNKEDLASLVVDTDKGKVLGFREDNINKFYGVPFAKPPIGDLRYAPPVDADSWDDILVCKKKSHAALQLEIGRVESKYSEDCLYSNIWAPVDAAKRKNLPVLVFIHGGAFVQGSHNQVAYDGTRFARDGVIQINIPYRLNALGFTAFDEIKEKYGYYGNMGLLDQIKGLKWVKENIAAFGGDPDNVTVCGESASSMSVSLLLLAQEASGLFTKAIMESGTSLAQHVVAPGAGGNKEQTIEKTKELMELVGAEDFQEMKKADGQKLVENSWFSMNMTKPTPVYFFPTFDGVLVPEIPYDATAGGYMNEVDILTGFNTDEGTVFIPETATRKEYDEFIDSGFGDKAEAVKEYFPMDENNSACDRLRYIVKLTLSVAGSKIYADALTKRGKNAYIYEFAYSTDEHKTAGLGAYHSIELGFVFDTLEKNMRNENSLKVKEDVHQRWLNFIRSGDPNDGGDLNVKWPLYNRSEQQIIKLDVEPETETFSFIEDVEFLRKLLWE